MQTTTLLAGRGLMEENPQLIWASHYLNAESPRLSWTPLSVCYWLQTQPVTVTSDRADVTINELMKGSAFSLDARDKNASVDFAFDHACPGLGIGFGFEGFSLGWIALATDLRFPLILATTPDCCQFDHSRHRVSAAGLWQNDVQDQDRFLSGALFPCHTRERRWCTRRDSNPRPLPSEGSTLSS